MKALFIPLALVACSDVRTSNALQDIDSTDPAAVERAAIKPWLAHDEQVPRVEDTLDAALRGRYAAGLDAAEDYREVVRTAAIEWVREVRRHTGESLHTRVESLQDDPDCLGSVIGDAMLLDYVEAVTSLEHRADRVEAALQALAHQTACLEQSQSMTLALAMKLAFDDAEASLRMNHLDGAIPYLAQATANPMLLVHEVERQWGTGAPLARWFVEYKDALVEGVRNHHQPATWHGLWLYDRVTGTVRGFQATEKADDENRVELAALWNTIAEPKREDLKCTYSEMIQRGSYDGRYHCLGAACASGDDRACAVPASGGDTAPAKGAVDMPELSTTAALACVQNAAAHSSVREQLTCLVEATGRHAQPLDRMAKQMAKAALNGVKPGGNCELGLGASGVINLMIPVWEDEIRDAEAAYAKAIKEAAGLTKEYATDKLAEAQSGKKPDEPMSADEILWTNAINDPEAAAKKLAADAKAARDKAVKEAQDKIDAAKKNMASTYGSGSNAGSNTGSNGGAGSGGAGSGGGSGGGAGSGSAGYCMDAASCGGCTAMSALAQAMLDCVSETREPTERVPLNVDPIDPQSPGTGRECFTDLSLNDGAALSQSCWSVRCGPSDKGTSLCCGGSSMANGEPMQIGGMCGSMDCADGQQPTYEGGHCSCGDSGGRPNGPMVPSGPNPINTHIPY